MLLEVIFAVALFSAAAAIVIGGLSACLRVNRDLRTESTAADLAVTLLSQIQMGTVPATDDGPAEYPEPQQDWSWQIVTADVDTQNPDAPPLTLVTILITRKGDDDHPGGYTFTLAQQLPRDWAGLPAAMGAAAATQPQGGAP